MDESFVAKPTETITSLDVESTTDTDTQSSSPRVGTAVKGWFQGHAFIKKNLHKPATCHHCCDLLWGILGTTGMICEICNFLAHEKCIRQVVSPCTCIIPFLIQDPMAHCWSDVGHFKRKFCNVCRKRLDDLLSVRCEICEYYTHYECLEFVSADCKVCSISTPSKDREKSPTILRKPSAPAPLSLPFPNIADIPELQSALAMASTPGSSSSCGGGTIGISDTDSVPPRPWTGGMAAFAAYAMRSAAIQAAAVTTATTTASTSVNSGGTLASISTSTVTTTSTSPFPQTGVGGVGAPNNPPPSPVSPQAPPPLPFTITPQIDRPVHHWREGNLPANSKCSSCKKTCWSAECLTGMRCEWCGVTVHYTCFRNLPVECDYGSLRDIMLPPEAVSIPRTSLLMEHIIGLPKPQPDFFPGLPALMDEFTSSGESLEESGFERRTNRDKSDRDFDDYVRVYDGMDRYRRHQCRYLSLGKNVSVRKVIELSLKAFQLPPDEEKDFYLVEINERDGSEHPLDSNTLFKRQLQFETRRPQIILRYIEREENRDYINVYPGSLVDYADISVPSIQVSITPSTSAHDVLVLSLHRLGVGYLDANKFNLVETVVDRGLVERVLHPNDRPWEVIDNVRLESVRALRLTRFYIRSVKDPYGQGVSLFVGNLKRGLSQRLYEIILLERLGYQNKWDAIEVIYYDFGSLVVIYSNAEKADEAYRLLKNSTFEDRPILAMILPRIKPEHILDGTQPLLVFVNVKSGGCQGLELITSFRKLLNPHQVFNLDNGGPLPGLHCFRHLSRFKILVCGGDGTVGWALSCLDNVGQDAACPTPPMAILPIGTGNDLARVLHWGPGYTGTEDPLQILRDVVEAEEIRLDRWTVVIKPDQVESDAQKKQLQIEANACNTNEDTSRIFVMNNYFGLGIDADLNLDFHLAREENPAKFNSRIHNKSVYFKMGLRKMVNQTKCKDLHQNVLIEVDGRQLDLPPIEGIIILNILSWGAGANPWGVEKDEAFAKPTHYDGLLEVVGVTGVVHMGQIFSGLRTGTRLAQGGHIRITLKSDIPVQVDGEPWIQSPGQIVVLRSALKATMLKKRKRRKVNRRHTEPGLGASSGVAGDASSGVVVPAILPTTTTVAETGSSSTIITTTAVPSASPLPSMVNSSSGSSSGGGGKSRHALTALRSEAAIGASQFTLHSQVAIPSDRRPVTPTPYLLHDFTLEDRFIDCGSGPELAPLSANHSHADGAAAAVTSGASSSPSSPSPDFLLNPSLPED
ncbi:Diacylglycerol kinase theta [Taenia crassiceps]|uniref:Diacylglycerol kinase n=1 Tax=Taenia crassiceps TaxID=6207 RepID=A0ABR4QM31_9CEST